MLLNMEVVHQDTRPSSVLRSIPQIGIIDGSTVKQVSIYDLFSLPQQFIWQKNANNQGFVGDSSLTGIQ